MRTEFCLVLIQVSNLQLFSLKYVEDYWKLFCLVANSVHTTDTDKKQDKTVLFCPYEQCEIGLSVRVT